MGMGVGSRSIMKPQVYGCGGDYPAAGTKEQAQSSPAGGIRLPSGSGPPGTHEAPDLPGHSSHAVPPATPRTASIPPDPRAASRLS